MLSRRRKPGNKTAQKRHASAIVFVIIVLCWSVTAPVTANSHQTDAEFTAAGTNVEIWNGAPLALHTKHPDTTVDANDTVVSRSIDRDISVYQSEFAAAVNDPGAFMFAPDARIRFDFDSTSGVDTAQFAGENVSLIAARLHSPADRAVTGVADVAPQRAGELLTAVDRHDRATFRHVFHAGDTRSARSIDESGFEGFYYNLGWYDDGPGTYAFYLIDTDDPDAVSVSEGGRLTVTQDVRILGTDTVSVRSGDSIVDAPFAGTVGDQLAFDIISQPDDTALSHTILVYNPETIENTALAYEPRSRAFLGVRSPRDVAVTTTGAVRGMINTDAQTTVYGTPLAAGPAAHSSEVGILLSHIYTAPQTASGETFDASLVAQTGVNGAETLPIQTHHRWEPGTYEYLHIAENSDGTVVEATNGTIELVGPDESFPPQHAATGHETTAVGPTVEQHDRGEQTELSVQNLRENQPVVLSETVQSPAPVSIEQFTVTSEQRVDAANISIDHTVPDAEYTASDRTVLSYHTLAADSAVTDMQAVFSIDESFADDVPISAGSVEFIRTETGDRLPADRTDDGYIVDIGQPETVTVAVTVPDSAEIPIEQHSTSLTTAEVDAGDSFTVETTVRNPTADTVEKPIEIAINGQPYRMENVSLGPFEERSVEYSYSLTAVGTFDIAVNGDHAGSLSVAESPTETAETAPAESQTDDSILAVVFTLLLLLSVTIVVVAAVASSQYNTQDNV